MTEDKPSPADEDGPRVKANEITGVARIVAGYQTFDAIPYRIRIAETKGKRGLVDGTIVANSSIIAELHDVGECAIEIAGGLGWFAFVVSDVPRGAIRLIGRPKNTGAINPIEL